jgi:hypothetical protein
MTMGGDKKPCHYDERSEEATSPVYMALVQYGYAIATSLLLRYTADIYDMEG